MSKNIYILFFCFVAFVIFNLLMSLFCFWGTLFLEMVGRKKEWGWRERKRKRRVDIWLLLSFPTHWSETESRDLVSLKQGVHSCFQFNLLLNCPLSCFSTGAGSVPHTDLGSDRLRGVKTSPTARPWMTTDLCNVLSENNYILPLFDDQWSNTFIYHHFMPHQTSCQPLHGSSRN